MIKNDRSNILTHSLLSLWFVQPCSPRYLFFQHSRSQSTSSDSIYCAHRISLIYSFFISSSRHGFSLHSRSFALVALSFIYSFSIRMLHSFFAFSLVLSLLLSRSTIESLHYSLIQNVNLVSQTVSQSNAGSCASCLCLMMGNYTFIAFNCHRTNQTCQMFVSYDANIQYQLVNTSQSDFYFLQLPPTSLTTSISTALISLTIVPATTNQVATTGL